MKKGYIIIVLILIMGVVRAQDIHFSQMYNAPLLVNPSLAGNDDGTFQGMMNYRSQWGNTYQTFGLSLDGGLMQRIDKGFLGIGGAIYNDTQGDVGLSKLNAKVSVAYHNQISRQQYFTAGLSGGIAQTSIDRSKFIYDDQYDGSGFNETFVSNEILFEPNSLSPDFSLGFNYLFKENEYVGKRRFLLGGAIHNLIKVNDAIIGVADESRRFRYTIHSEASLPIRGTNMEVQPSGFFNLQGPSRELLIGANVRYEIKQESKFTNFAKTNAVTFGVFARELKSVIAFAGLQLDKYNIGISYDIDLNSNVPRGGLEISIKYVNLTKFNKVYTPAPRL
jgi:type IX secretion system PorP/SprF family membrane protein